jgi:Probable Zinc-ribbon domain
MQREACPATCLATTHPHLAAEWDHAANMAAGNGLTPENVTPGSDREAFWTCRTHGAYPRRVNERTGLGFGCPIEEQEKGRRERRERVNAKRREDRARALDALARRRDGDRGP